MKKELYFGFSLMALIIAGVVIFMPWTAMTNGHYGLLMLALVVVAIMAGFPTAFTLMGMGMIFAYFAFHSGGTPAAQAIKQTLDLMVQRTYAVMTNDVLISIPLFVFMGYLVERANLIEKLFKSLHLSLSRVPGSLAVATIFTCAVFATATGIVGAVVTLMGLLALPQMLRSGYSVQVSAGAITAGGCLGILIPPSVMLIVYGATAGVSVVQLYAGAFFPGIMLASLYIIYVIALAKIKPNLMPSLPEAERRVPLPSFAEKLAAASPRALPGLLKAVKGSRNADVPMSTLLQQLAVTLLPLLVFVVIMSLLYRAADGAPAPTASAAAAASASGVAEPPGTLREPAPAGGLQEPPPASGVQEPPGALKEPPGALKEPPPAGGLQEPPPVGGLKEPPGALKEPPPAGGLSEPPPVGAASSASPASGQAPATTASGPLPTWFWVVFGIGAAGLTLLYVTMTWVRLEIFKMLLASFFPLAVLILAVLGTIVFGLATPTEAAAVGSLGGFLLAAAYKQLNMTVLKESVYLTGKTTAMVCWLFVGSSIFSAAFALLGGQEIVENWVMSLGLTKIQFLVLSQVIIFLLGWPLEWTEIIVIFMPIFIPLLDNFGVDPLFFGLLVALNLQTAFLSPPVAMAAFYLKGVSPPHVTLNQIFAGMLPFMGIQVVAIVLLYTFPAIGMWLPTVLYR
jgi:TRAP-type mannitol/chloroaromatic compound transport system permease large subunit